MVRIKKTIIILMCILMMVIVSGCWASKCNNVPSAMQQRAALNQDIIDKLEQAQLISKETSESMKKAIESNIKDTDNIPKKSITWYWRGTSACLRSVPTYYKGPLGLFGRMTELNFPYQKDTGSNVGKVIDTEIVPIDGVGTDHIKKLMEELNWEVWVLKNPEAKDRDKDEDNSKSKNEGNQENNGIKEEDKYKSLDEIDKLVGDIKKSTDRKFINSKIAILADTYFEGTGKKLLDPEKDKVITETKLPPMTTYTGCVCGEEGCSGYSVTGPQVKNNELGYDLVLTYIGVPVTAVRFLEFNPPVVQKLLGADGADKDKYLVDPSGRRVFLLEYPVNYIDTIELVGDNKYKCKIKQSEDLTVNIFTGKIKNSKGVELKQAKNKLIRIGGEGGHLEEGTSSFIAYGKGEVPDIGHGKEKVECGAVVLRDYLEYTYMPGVVAGEDIVAIGRRIRITDPVGEITKPVATFIDVNGRVVERTEKRKEQSEDEDESEERYDYGSDTKAYEIFVSDIVDLPTVGEGNKKTKLGKPKQKNGESKVNSDNQANRGRLYERDLRYFSVSRADDTRMGVDNDEDGESDDSGLVTEDYTGLLKSEFGDVVSPTYKFPSDKIATEDGKDESKGQMIFYGLLIDKNPFETAMYSDWIKKKDLENGSVDWWNDWLKENDFQYQIDKNALEKNFLGNFQFEMAKEGFIVLNTNTIAKIQKDFNEKVRFKEVSRIRTVFIALGFILMAYSMILLAAWAFDCVIMTGFNLLTLVTFGRWVAVRSKEELPNMDLEGKHYIDFGRVLISCVIIMGVGFILTLVDIVDIINAVINAFGGLADMIDKNMLGN